MDLKPTDAPCTCCGGKPSLPVPWGAGEEQVVQLCLACYYETSSACGEEEVEDREDLPKLPPHTSWHEVPNTTAALLLFENPKDYDYAYGLLQGRGRLVSAIAPYLLVVKDRAGTDDIPGVRQLDEWPLSKEAIDTLPEPVRLAIGAFSRPVAPMPAEKEGLPWDTPGMASP